MSPDGPATPPEDVWSDAVALTTLECGSSEVAAARMNWIDRITQERHLAAPEISRRFRVGTRGYRGEPDAVGMLLDARLHMARRALEDGSETIERACTVEVDAKDARVVADSPPRARSSSSPSGAPGSAHCGRRGWRRVERREANRWIYIRVCDNFRVDARQGRRRSGRREEKKNGHKRQRRELIDGSAEGGTSRLVKDVPSIPPPPVSGPWRSYKEVVSQLAARIVRRSARSRAQRDPLGRLGRDQLRKSRYKEMPTVDGTIELGTHARRPKVRVDRARHRSGSAKATPSGAS
jgi:hypothetical protein